MFGRLDLDLLDCVEAVIQSVSGPKNCAKTTVADLVQLFEFCFVSLS